MTLGEIQDNAGYGALDAAEKPVMLRGSSGACLKYVAQYVATRGLLRIEHRIDDPAEQIAGAFQKAAAGQGVVLYFGEILRFPIQHLSQLLPAITPRDGKYLLRGATGIIEIPVNGIRIVAAAGNGAGYARIAPDFASAFHTINLPIPADETPQRFRNALADALPGDTDAVNMLEAIFYKLDNAHTSGIFPKRATLRMCVNAAYSASRRIDLGAQRGDALRAGVLDRAADIVALSVQGKPLPAQMLAFQRIVNSVPA